MQHNNDGARRQAESRAVDAGPPCSYAPNTLPPMRLTLCLYDPNRRQAERRGVDAGPPCSL